MIQCSKCGNKMTQENEFEIKDFGYNLEKTYLYAEVIFHCEKCDNYDHKEIVGQIQGIY